MTDINKFPTEDRNPTVFEDVIVRTDPSRYPSQAIYRRIVEDFRLGLLPEFAEPDDYLIDFEEHLGDEDKPTS